MKKLKIALLIIIPVILAGEIWFFYSYDQAEAIGESYQYETDRGIRHFDSHVELKQFLDDNPMVLHLYSGVEFNKVDCDDYAYSLQSIAYTAGYFMSVQYTSYYGEPHLLNSAKVGNYLYFIEPTDYKIWIKTEID